LSSVVNQIRDQDSSSLTLFLRNSNSLQESLEDISTVYLDTIELVFQFEQKKLLNKIDPAQEQLSNMLDVPLQYYMCVSRLKELTEESRSQSSKIQRGKTIKFSRLASEHDVGKALHRSYSMVRNEGVNLQELLPSWVNKHRASVNNLMKDLKLENKASLEVVEKFPWILGFDIKEKLFRNSLVKENEEYEYDDEKTIFVKRDNILEDTIRQFEVIPHKEIISNSKIEFVKEPGVDAGGLKKEWLTLLTKEIFDPIKGLFQLSPNSRTIHPHPLSIIQPDALTYFNIAGFIVGLAIREKIPINVSFSKSFLKLMMDIQPNMNDLEDIDPELVSSWRWMLKNDVEDLEQPFMYELDVFGTRVIQELCENGSETIVDEENKASYISEMCYAKSYNEVKQQVISFKNGLFEVINKDLLRIFSSGELEVLISGLSEIDSKDLLKHLQHKDIKKKQLVQWFKEIIEVMDQSMLANLLFFVTGTTKVPHEGFKNSPLSLTETSDGFSTLPVAHTCFRQLEIPAYESKEQFYEKLVLAISEGKEGFYIA